MLADAMHTIGNRGVDLFFVLSGYLIYGSLMRKPQPFGRFMLRRIDRIYPAFLVVFAIYVGLSFSMPSERLIPAGWSGAMLYLIANVLLLPGLFPIEPVLTVAWSLSYELFYYLAIPLIIVSFSRRTRSPTWRVVFFTMIAAAIAGYCLLQAGHVRLMMFVAGILLHETMRSRRLRPPGSTAALSCLIVALLATLIPTLGSTGYTLKTILLFGAFFAICFSCFSMPSRRLARWFSATPLRWLGNMSYSYYLLHGLALKGSVRRAWPCHPDEHERNALVLDPVAGDVCSDVDPYSDVVLLRRISAVAGAAPSAQGAQCGRGRFDRERIAVRHELEPQPTSRSAA